MKRIELWLLAFMAHFEDSLKTVANYPKLAIAIVYCRRLPIMYSLLGMVAIFSLEMQACLPKWKVQHVRVLYKNKPCFKIDMDKSQ